jgi:hypothetical protein
MKCDLMLERYNPDDEHPGVIRRWQACLRAGL